MGFFVQGQRRRGWYFHAIRSCATSPGRDAATMNAAAATTFVSRPEEDARSGNSKVADNASLAAKTKDLMITYAELCKVRLSSLVVVTTMVGYYMGPDPFFWDQFLLTTLGTSLAIGSANSFNQIFEINLDSQMARTAKRMLPSGKISVLHASIFGVVTGVAGSSLLFYQVDPTAGALALANILLYTLVYTPLKQVHPLNTWVGAVVGAVPPLIGWAANTGGHLSGGAWTLAALLYLWQIPHFLALSYGLKDDYSRAGYKMLSVTNLPKVAKVSYRYCFYMIPISVLAAATEMTTWTFALDSMLCHAYLLMVARQFAEKHDKPTARNLFFATIRFLPLFLGLMMFHKKGKHSSDEEKETNNGTLSGTQAAVTAQ